MGAVAEEAGAEVEVLDGVALFEPEILLARPVFAVLGEVEVYAPERAVGTDFAAQLVERVAAYVVAHAGAQAAWWDDWLAGNRHLALTTGRGAGLGWVSEEV